MTSLTLATYNVNGIRARLPSSCNGWSGSSPTSSACRN